MDNKKETIICRDCGAKFELTEGWESLMERNPEMQKPKRCYICRQKRKREKAKSSW